MRSDDRKILLGKLGKPHGVKGFLYFHYYGESLKSLLSYEFLYLEDSSQIKLERFFEKSNRLIVKFQNYNDRDSIESFRDKEVFIPESELPELEDGEVYLYQLQGLIVKNLNDTILGEIKGSMGTKSNEVLIVHGCKESIDDKERLIPYIKHCLLYTSPSPRDRTRSRMPSSA